MKETEKLEYVGLFIKRLQNADMFVEVEADDCADVLIEVLEKQIPLKPIIRKTKINETTTEIQHVCSRCGKGVIQLIKQKYCRECGQAIKWNDNP